MMQTPDLVEELAELRAQIKRLQQREIRLQDALHSADGTPAPLRPGWPIRRCSSALH